MKLYNTLTKKKEEFIPLEPGKVKMYVCGPTVYDYIHIGNARPYVVFDTIRRYMEYKGYEVNYVQNFTDVDDKIINRANKEDTTMKVISDRYVEEALKDAKGLNIKVATHHPRVTQEMPEIIDMIKVLIDKGFAYEVDGSVYFDTAAFDGYGKLSKKNIDELQAGASERVDVDNNKKSPMDFILWKPAKPNEPKWESPWGEGRPGWHIECSVMAKKYLGDSIDIHAGGEDLIFPHHENEVAQSEAANGAPFAKYWMHNGFINVDNKKMSKSLGNFFTLRDIVKEFPYEVIRFFILNGQYRSPINFSRELIQAAQNGLERIKNGMSNIKYTIENTTINDMTQQEKALLAELSKYKVAFETAMEDDFNTADAVTAIYELVKFANIQVNENASKEFSKAVQAELEKLTDILGLLQAQEEVENNIDTTKIEAMIEQRQNAKKNKDFALADRIREELKDMGIVLEDTRQGVRWSYKAD
jgi:cysteinyl-tRNA synthetase